MGMECNACGETAQFFAQAMILDKYQVSYFRCERCGFVQTEEPYWLEESYSSAITQIDIGPVNRAYTASEITKQMILLFFEPHSKYVDYGAGYGIFVRRMRDLGFDFRYHDRYCENIFAKGFEFSADLSERHELLTAFEVFEHMRRPSQEVPQLLELSRNIFFTTEILPGRIPKPQDWWYYGLSHGQHISFFTRKALTHLAQRMGLNLYSSGSYHLLTEKTINRRLFNAVIESRLPHFVTNFIAKRKNVRSLLEQDFEKISGTRITG